MLEKNGHKLGIINLLGRVYMEPLDNPFRTARREISSIQKQTNNIIVDFHGEATSEKVALGWFLDGKVSAVIGTHTHVQTADERILPGGTAYITDLGMTGPYDSVLGRVKERVLGSLISAVPFKFDVATGDPRLCGIVVSVETKTGRATAIERIQVNGMPETEPGTTL